MRSSMNDADLRRRSLLALGAMTPALAAGMSSAAAAVSGAGGKAPSDLAETIKSYEQATFSNDIATLGKLISEDYLLVNSDTTLQDKQSYLNDFKTPGFKLDPTTMEQVVLKVWDRTALAAGLWRLGWRQEGKHQTRLLRIANLWAKHDGRWRLAYTQLTRVPQ